MLFRRRVNLDVAASAPVLPGALRAFSKAAKLCGNPSAPHEEGRAARAVLEEARTSIARLAGVRAPAVVFVSGATEANNLALRSVFLESSGHILYAEGAHASITETVAALVKEGCTADAIPFKDGALDRARLVALIRSDTKIVVVERVASETGVMTDCRDVRRTLDANGAAHILLQVDATQAPFIDSIERTHLGADYLTLDAQKIGGVRGIGALLHSPRAKVHPMIQGGGQEQGVRSGTPSPALAAAFAHALTVREEGRAAFIERASRLRTRMKEEMKGDAIFVNEGRQQAPHILNLSLLERDTDYLVALMDAAGVAVSTRSSCETDAEGSRGVMALVNDAQRSAATLRISFGPETTDAQIDAGIRAFSQAVRFIDQHRLK